MRWRIPLVLALAPFVALGCNHQPVSPDDVPVEATVSEGPNAYFSSAKGFDKAGFVPFVSFGHGCGFAPLGPPEFVDGTMIMRWSNFNFEVSKEAMFAGPATSTARGVIDIATGKFLEFDISFLHEPTAVNGTWVTNLDGILLLDGEKAIKAYMSGVGTGDLEGLGIEYVTVINAKASAAPPHIVCEGESPNLSTGKIFQLD